MTVKNIQPFLNSISELKGYTIFTLDTKGNILNWNEGLKKLKGYSEEEIIGKNYSVFFSDEDKANGVPEKLIETAKKEKNAYVDTWVTRKGGSTFWGKISVVAIYENGEVTGFLEITNDLTECKEHEEKFRKILRSAPDPLLLANSDGVILRLNKQVERVFGYNREELINQKVEILIPHRYREGHSSLRNGYFANPYTRPMGSNLDLSGLKKNGEEFPAEISISPLHTDDEGLLTIITIRDITLRKELLDQVVEAKQKAEESNELKSAFLSTMTHELKTPLNHILGFSEIILGLTKEEETSEYVRIIHKSGTELLAIIEDIFSLSQMKTENIKMRKESVKMSAFLITIKEFSDRLLSKSEKEDLINLTVESEDSDLMSKKIVIDKYKVKQVIKNLVENAVKFTNKGAITINVYMHDDAFMAVSVKDTGIGIPDEKQETIFEFFRQGDNSLTRSHKGIGVSLTIAESIARALGGYIKLTSEVGKGSDFTFLFPTKLI